MGKLLLLVKIHNCLQFLICLLCEYNIVLNHHLQNATDVSDCKKFCACGLQFFSKLYVHLPATDEQCE